MFMGVGLYELSDGPWNRIEGLLPGRVETVGRTASDNRVFINGVLWMLRSGAHWHDLRTLRQVQERAQALQPLVCQWSLGEGLCN
jgi:transposase